MKYFTFSRKLNRSSKLSKAHQPTDEIRCFGLARQRFSEQKIRIYLQTIPILLHVVVHFTGLKTQNKAPTIIKGHSGIVYSEKQQQKSQSKTNLHPN